MMDVFMAERLRHSSPELIRNREYELVAQGEGFAALIPRRDWNTNRVDGSAERRTCPNEAGRVPCCGETSPIWVVIGGFLCT